MDKKTYQIRSYLTAVLTRTEDAVNVEFHSTIHVNKIVNMTVSYSPDFYDSEILKDADFLKFVKNHYGDT